MKALRRIILLALLISLPTWSAFAKMSSGDSIAPLWTLLYLPHKFCIHFAAILTPWIFESVSWFQVVMVTLFGFPASLVYALIVYLAFAIPTTLIRCLRGKRP